MDSLQSHAGDGLSAELTALANRAAICPRDDRLMVRMAGDDRISFLHGMCSNDIKGLKPGMLTYALILTDHAHVIGDLYVWADNGVLHLDVDRALWPRIRQHLEKFLVADDVEMEEQEELAILDVAGPDAATAVAAVMPAAAQLAPWRVVLERERMGANLPRIGLTAFTVVLPSSQAGSFLREMMAANPGLREVSVAALDVARVEQGYARVGVDATEKTIALEARLERGISYSKGCYVGQETVERATARGGVKKRLYGLRISGRRPQTGASAWLDGREVGQVSSIAASPRLGIVGLAIMHHSAWQPGTRVVVKDGEGEVAAVVSELPFE